MGAVYPLERWEISDGVTTHFCTLRVEAVNIYRTTHRHIYLEHGGRILPRDDSNIYQTAQHHIPISCLEYGGSKFTCNVGKHVPDYFASHAALPGSWILHVLPKRRQTYARLHDVTSRTAVIYTLDNLYLSPVLLCSSSFTLCLVPSVSCPIALSLSLLRHPLLPNVPVLPAFLFLSLISHCVLSFLLSLLLLAICHCPSRLGQKQRAPFNAPHQSDFVNQLHYCKLIPSVGIFLQLHVQSNSRSTRTSMSMILADSKEFCWLGL
jgi:hypothetical protein